MSVVPLAADDGEDVDAIAEEGTGGRADRINDADPERGTICTILNSPSRKDTSQSKGMAALPCFLAAARWTDWSSGRSARPVPWGCVPSQLAGPLHMI